MMNLVFSPKAIFDLEDIGDYISRDNPKRALSFLDEIEAHCYQILEMPTAFPQRNDIFPGLRMCIHGNYLIFFNADVSTVRIERIVQGGRKLQNLFV